MYLTKGYSKKWINERLKSIEVRKELTDEYVGGAETKEIFKRKKIPALECGAPI